MSVRFPTRGDVSRAKPKLSTSPRERDAGGPDDGDLDAGELPPVRGQPDSFPDLGIRDLVQFQHAQVGHCVLPPLMYKHATQRFCRDHAGPGEGHADVIMSRTCGGVNGVALTFTPNGLRASSTASLMTVGTAMIPPSPTPFVPRGVTSDGVSRCAIVMRGADLKFGI